MVITIGSLKLFAQECLTMEFATNFKIANNKLLPRADKEALLLKIKEIGKVVDTVIDRATSRTAAINSHKMLEQRMDKDSEIEIEQLRALLVNNLKLT
jgi:hypothetical protein